MPMDRTQGRERFGEMYRRQEQDIGSPYPTGALSAMGRSMGFASQITKDRWASIFDAPEAVSADDWDELVGDRQVPWEPGMTRGRADLLIQEYDYHQYAQQYEGRPIAEFIGMIPPTLFDPVSVATMPIGGPNFTAATRSATLGGFMRHSVTGGAKAGAASAPVEAVVQTQAYGGLRADEMAASIIGPVVASPLLTAPARVLRSLGQQGQPTAHSQPDVRTAASAANQSDFPLDIERIIGPYQREAGVSLAPPVRQIDPSEPVPRARLDETFGGWDGGARDWFRQFARGEESAIEYARARGFDPDNDALRNLVQQEVRQSARRGFTPDEGRFTDLRDLMDAVQGRATPDQVTRLRERGVAEPLERLQEVEAELREVSPEQRRIAEAQTKAGRELRALRSEMDELTIRPEFREMAEALGKPPAARSNIERIRYKRFIQSGAAGLQDSRMADLEGQYRDTNQQLINLRERMAARKGRKPKAMHDEVARLEAQRSSIQQDLEALRGGLARDVDDQVPMEALLDALDTARMEAPVETPPLRSTTQGEGEAVMARTDPEVENIESWMRSVGQDPAEARAVIRGVERAMAECRL